MDGMTFFILWLIGLGAGYYLRFLQDFLNDSNLDEFEMEESD